MKLNTTIVEVSAHQVGRVAEAVEVQARRAPPATVVDQIVAQGVAETARVIREGSESVEKLAKRADSPLLAGWPTCCNRESLPN